ncbi:MAG TPA: type II toxin-antitoxin system PemK/MazF family toxin [Flavisolibacter sp.]|nr:type II toxin-antitoxin system PemK/MazF family toxin [Flavisolibacter sp.]
MQKGDIVLIKFPFTDLSGNKLRPAVILINSKADVTVSFISSQLNWQETNDVLLTPSSLNGIKKTSLIKLNKIATIDKVLMIGKIGAITSTEMIKVNESLKQLFQLFK